VPDDVPVRGERVGRAGVGQSLGVMEQELGHRGAAEAAVGDVRTEKLRG
jgi:hypothetical protein